MTIEGWTTEQFCLTLQKQLDSLSVVTDNGDWFREPTTLPGCEGHRNRDTRARVQREADR